MSGPTIRLAPLAAALLTLSACGGATQLTLRPNDATIPIVNGEDPGQALGQCVRFTENGPVTTPCPLGVEAFFGKPVTHEMTKPGAYAHGVYTWGAGVHRADETVVAYEIVTYSSRAMTWKAKLKAKDLAKLVPLCSADDLKRTLLVVRAFDGCAKILAGDRRDAWRWTVENLAHEGATIGQPERFWSQEPDLDEAPGGATCKTQRVVQVEVVPVERACERYRAALFPREQVATTP